MENSRYARNRIYIPVELQEKIKTVPILLAGCGIGSNIAECALRFGFETLTLVDGDTVELSNLNRQNYTEKNMAQPKARALYDRLKAINPLADISCHAEFITPENVDRLTVGHEIAINALDFDSDIPLIFDSVCNSRGITVLHPFNLGWETLVTVVAPGGQPPENLGKAAFNEKVMVDYACNYLRNSGRPAEWLEDVLAQYKREEGGFPPPQLAIGSFAAAALCTRILYAVTTGAEYRRFPDFYMSSLRGDLQ